MHIEDVRDGRRFMEAARRVVVRKPLLLFKPGRSREGARAAASHAGSLAGDEAVYDTAIRQVGAIRLNSWPEYWDMPRIFAYQPLPQGDRIAILTLAGGVGVAAVDTAIASGLSIARFSPATADKLRKIYPRLSNNPVDLGPILSVSDNPFAVEEDVIAAVLADANVDCAAISVYVGFEDLIAIIVEMFEHLKPRIAKPVALWIYGMQLPVLDEMYRQLEERGLPTYLDLESAVRALGMAVKYSKIKAGRG
jgi:acetyltransferase